MPVHLRQRKATNGQIIYFLDITGYGPRSRKTLDIPRHLPEHERTRLATVIRNDTETQLMEGKYGRAPKTSQRNFITYFSDYVTMYRPDNNTYKNTLRHLKLCFGNSLQGNQVNDRNMEQWKQYLLSNFNGQTPETMWAKTKAVINHGIQDGFFGKDPCPNVRRPKKPRSEVKQVLFENELKKLAATTWPHPIVCSAFLFCCFTGLGYKEVRLLKWNQISFPDKKLIYRRGKNSIRVAVDLSESAIAVLPERVGDHRVYPTLPSDVTCKKHLQNWCKAAGIEKNITWYCGRHTFAVLLLMNGANLKTVADLMGHTSTERTEIYLQFVDSLKTEAVNRLPKLEF